MYLAEELKCDQGEMRDGRGDEARLREDGGRVERGACRYSCAYLGMGWDGMGREWRGWVWEGVTHFSIHPTKLPICTSRSSVHRWCGKVPYQVYCALPHATVQ